MTRDEAYALTAKAWHVNDDNSAAELGPHRLLDLFISLGMLKLDEPKRLPQKMRDFIRDPRLIQGEELERIGNLQAVLADAGLRIIEK